MSQREWREFADDLVNKILYALDYWCYNVHGDPLDCFETYKDKDLEEIAESFAGWGTTGITERDLELLEEMPLSIYKEYDQFIRDRIEKVADQLHETYCEEIKEELRKAIMKKDRYWAKYWKKKLDEYWCE